MHQETIKMKRVLFWTTLWLVAIAALSFSVAPAIPQPIMDPCGFKDVPAAPNLEKERCRTNHRDREGQCVAGRVA